MTVAQRTISTGKVAVIGFGVTGESVVRHLLAHSKEVVVLDTRPERAVDAQGVDIVWECRHWPDIDVDYAVLSPGLDMDSCLVASARDAGVQLCSDIDLFFDAATAPVIGITGTNGKSTVTSLVGHVLNHAGISCGVGGNLGVAALDLLDEEHACYVLELSSFQLERSQLHEYRASTILNLSEDHLDKHTSMRAYTSSKHKIYATAGRCVFNRDDLATLPPKPEAGVSFGAKEPLRDQDWGIRSQDGLRYLARGDKLICTVDTLPLSGHHNEQNALAACALLDDWLAEDEIARGLASFKGLPHRFEVVQTVAGITYINDSKATNLGATVAALAGMPVRNQVILIAGGDAKGVDLSPLGSELTGRVSLLIALGKDGSHLQSVASHVGVNNTAAVDMLQAVELAHMAAAPGDTVLLSPACASLDMFESYAQRGSRFVEAVHGLVSADTGVDS